MHPPLDARCTRRQFVTWSTLSAGTLLAACGVTELPAVTDRTGEESTARITARPILAPTVPRAPLASGIRILPLASGPEVLLYVPAGYTPSRNAPLAVVLHGAGQANDGALAILQPYADANGLLLVAPQATGTIWDFLYMRYGVDVASINAALARVFQDCAVDPARIALAGFSDGASYALSLGLTNGDLFTRVVAFSPGILAPAGYHGTPKIFESHGTQDAILSIDGTSRRFVPALRKRGYDVTYREFDGPHAVPTTIAQEAAAFIAA